MSFWTNVSLVRPGPPPRLSVGALLHFVERIAKTGVVSDPAIRTFQVKCGRRIDADHRDTSNETEVMPGMFQIGEYDWDIKLKGSSEVQAMRSQLLTDTQLVYRAYVGFDFGSLDQSITELLRTNHEDGTPNLVLGDVAVQVDVLTASSLDTMPVHVGWIGVGFGGQGYLHPWRPADVLSRVAKLPPLRAVEACCRDAFPVPTPSMGRRIKDLWYRRYRRKAIEILGDYWPYSDSIPSDWAWAIGES